MGVPRISGAVLKTAIDKVAETGMAVKIETKEAVIHITPPAKQQPVNPADLIDP